MHKSCHVGFNALFELYYFSYDNNFEKNKNILFLNSSKCVQRTVLLITHHYNFNNIYIFRKKYLLTYNKIYLYIQDKNFLS